MTTRAAGRLHPRLRRGFTLVELLVVIAIIVVLAALLFPMLHAARRSAQRTACQSNLRQLTVAALLYADDWDGCFPGQDVALLQDVFGPLLDSQPAPHLVGDVAGKVWVSQVQPYLRNNAILVCPGADPAKTTYLNEIPVSYGINLTLCESLGGWTPSSADESRVFLFADAPNPWSSECKGDRYMIAYPGFTACDYYQYVFNGGPEATPAHQRHTNGSNVAFVDGHVKLHDADYIMQRLKVLPSLPPCE